MWLRLLWCQAPREKLQPLRLSQAVADREFSAASVWYKAFGEVVGEISMLSVQFEKDMTGNLNCLTHI